MTAAIYKNRFAGQRQVTCYSCHHGSSHPANTPPVLTSDAPAHSEAPGLLQRQVRYSETPLDGIPRRSTTPIIAKWKA